MPDLVTIVSKGGAKFTVAKASAGRFKGVVDDLEAAGYPIKGEQSGGYNDRNIAGTNTKSQHAFGNAIDVNWTDNPRGARGTIPADVARDVASRRGMIWGGAWKNPDDMHFEADPDWQAPQQQNVASNGAINSVRPQTPGAYTSPTPASAQGAFMAAAAPSPAQPAKPTLGGAFSGALQGFADAAGGSGHSDTQAALSNANQSALAEEDQRAANALQTVLQRRAPTYG